MVLLKSYTGGRVVLCLIITAFFTSQFSTIAYAQGIFSAQGLAWNEYLRSIAFARQAEVIVPAGTPGADTPLITEELPIETFLLFKEEPAPIGGVSRSTAASSGFTLDLTSDTGTNTTDNRTNDTTPEFTVEKEGAYGGSAGVGLHLYYKRGACGALPIATKISALTGWMLYKKTATPVSTTTTTGITSTIALTTDGTYCFLAFYGLSNGSLITTESYGQLAVTIDTTPPIVAPRVSPSLPSVAPTKFSHTGDVAVALDNFDRFGTAVSLSADGALMAVGAQGDDDGGTTHGAVYLFEKQRGGSWSRVHKFSDHTSSTESANRFTAANTDVNLNNGDSFGTSVFLSADGALLAAGAHGDDSGGTGRGAVYLFEKQSTGKWRQVHTISDHTAAPETQTRFTVARTDVNLSNSDNFGVAVSLSADGARMAVGATGDDGAGTEHSNRGAVYLFEKQSTGLWTKVLKITDSTGGAEFLTISLSNYDSFGSAVSLSADGALLAVGAPADDGNGRNKGAVYLFEKSAGTGKSSDGRWQQIRKFSDHTASDVVSTRFTDSKTDVNLNNAENFGTAVSLSADGALLAAGAHYANSSKGAVYFFEKSGGVWAKTLDISDNARGAAQIGIGLDVGDRFGTAVSLSADGTLLAAGAYGDDDTDGSNINNDRGAAYVFSVTPAPATSATITAVDTESGVSAMKSVKVAGAVCGAAQFSGDKGKAYTEGSVITLTDDSDNGKWFCFRSRDVTGNSGYGVSAALAVDTTAPVLTAFKIGTGRSATYKVTVTDVSPVTGRTKDNVVSGRCTDSTATDSSWHEYIPGTDTGTADDTNGRCVIITDAAGNKAARHLDDNDGTINTIPEAPTGLTATWKAAAATLHWSDPSDADITGYEYRQCDGDGDSCGSWQSIAGSNAATISHDITGLSTTTAHTLNIRALNANGSSVAASTAGTTGTAHDADHDGLIDVDTIQKLNAIRWDLDGDGIPASGQGTNYTTAFPNAATNLGCPKGVCTGYELTADLDLDDNDPGDRTDDTYHNGGSGWAPIAPTDSPSFTGTFNGNGFVIDNLFINRASATSVGLFGNNAGTITALGLRDVTITASVGTGSVVGVNRSAGTVTAVFSTGTVTGTWATGGLVGFNQGAVEASHTSAAVNGTANIVGGLVGYNSGSGASIRNSYAHGATTRSDGSTAHLGGLVGQNNNGATIANSYWDITVTTHAGTDTTGATGKTTAQLQSPTGYIGIYAAWDDRDIDNTDTDNNNATGADSPWNFGTGSHYPALTFGDHRVATQWSSAGNLSDLTTSAGILAPVFDAYHYTYTADVPAATASITITPTAETAGATITVNGATATSGSASAPIALAAGATTTVIIVVTSASGTTNIYTVTISRLKDYDDNDNGLIDIRTHQQLNAIRWDLDGDGIPATEEETNYTAAFPGPAAGMGCKLTDHDNDRNTADVPTCTGYELRADIDLDTDGDGDSWTGSATNPVGDADDAYYNSGAGWAPIGPSPLKTFHTTFNGNGHTISNLFINRSAIYVGLFGFVGRPSNSHTRIDGVGLKNAFVRGGNVTGALVGRSEKPITTSWATGAVRGGIAVGGLVGLSKSAVTASYSLASVTATNRGGGLIGVQEDGSITTSYAGGEVTVTGAAEGGLVAAKTGSPADTDNYYDTDTTGLIVSVLGTGKTTAEMTAPTGYADIYANWNIDTDNADTDNTLTTGRDNPWNFGSNSHYPVLISGGHRLSTQRSSAENLSALTSSIGTMQPSFNPYTYAYTVDAPTTTASITITPTVYTAGAIITIDNISITSGSASAPIALTAGTTKTVTITVTSSSGNVNVYTIAITRMKDYDDDNDGLIDIRTHQQLNAIRWDLDGDGVPATGQGTNYTAAFPHAAAGMGCKPVATVPTCTGYELRADIDLDTDGDNDGTYTGDEATPTADTGDAYHNSGSGWEPIGTPTVSFSASFNGNGHTISNLFINRASTDNVGLFGHIGTPSNNYTRIEAVGISNALVIGDGKTGILVGESEKPVTASWTTGAVRGGTQVGGLIGLSESDVTASYSLASVTAANKGGGLIGEQDGGTVTASYAGGEVTVTGADKGGLVATATNTTTDTDNHYNSDTTTLSSSALGTAQTDAALRTPAGYTGIYANWNVDVGGTNAADDPWHITAGNYPVLDHGTGADTAEQTAEQIPAAPAGLTAAPGNTEVTVSWTNPNNTTITKYQYKQKVGAADYDASWTDIPLSSAITSYTFTGLTNSTAYRYKIRAVNTVGSGIEAETAAVTPLADISAAPTSVTLVSDTDTITPYTGAGTHRTRDATPTISFTAVSGADITVEYKQGSTGTFTPTGITLAGSGIARTITLPTLSIDDTYSVKITQDEDGGGTTYAPVSTTYTFIFDTLAPTVTPAITKIRAATSNGIDYLSIRDNIIVTFTFDEDMSATTLTGKFMNDGIDIPSSGGAHHFVTAARTSATAQTLTLTVSHTGPSVASGKLKYQLTNGAALTDLAGNPLGAQIAATIADTVIDTARPVLSPVKIGTDKNATYKITVADISPVTGKTKDSIVRGSCTDRTIPDNSWDNYIPGTDIGTADDTTGRCVIITDAAGNSKARHLLDSDNIPPDFTLDITGDTTVDASDAITHYIYEIFKNQEPNGKAAIAPFLTGGKDALAIWNDFKTSATTRDFSGNGITDSKDAIIHYIYEVFKNQAPNGKAAMAPFLTETGARDSTAVYALLNRFAKR